MKEIEFRAWDKESDFWIDNFSISNCGEFIYLEDGFERGISDVILEQYTGLRDKNGKEIYENDVVRLMQRGYNDGGMGDKLITRVVKFENGRFENCYTLDKYGIEIIGNIHENPELLELSNA